jgi:hypothetical protein
MSPTTANQRPLNTSSTQAGTRTPAGPIRLSANHDAALGRIKIELERRRAVVARGLDEARGGIDRARSTDRDEQVGIGDARSISSIR